MRILLISLVLLFGTVLLGQDAEDLNRCVPGHKTSGEGLREPAFFEFVLSASIEEIKNKKQDIQFNKLDNRGGSVIYNAATRRYYFREESIEDHLELMKFFVENGALIYAINESDGLRSEICGLVAGDTLELFEYLLSIEPHLANIKCSYRQRNKKTVMVPIAESVKSPDEGDLIFAFVYKNREKEYIRNKAKVKQAKLKLLKEAKARAATVPLTYTASVKLSAPRCE
ncbi:hypothetical protein EHR03_12940 [Leptospira mayottensis]|uniref:Uncharacterized protein n=1 Tax=Leptospira mayottensis 200901116 TaxID=1192864 RepID=M6UZU1_9LEPT|nr:hypothetical protein [Leptospira mayottensis]AVH81606.1 hypothetical protein [Leptospira mayottensis 200901116]TGN00331.1 hypothetical protein EHR03_12940 [Leptospira mayottensis]